MASNKLEFFAERIIPQFIRDEYPDFVGLVQSYFRYLDREYSPNQYTVVANLPGDNVYSQIPGDILDPNNLWEGDFVELNEQNLASLQNIVGSNIVGLTSGASRKVISVYQYQGTNYLKLYPYNSEEVPFSIGETIQYTDVGEYAQLANLVLYSDIDQTTDEFFEYYKDQYLTVFNSTIRSDLRFVLKRIRDFYKGKSSENSFSFLFRSLFDEKVDFYYPKIDILRCSDSSWTLPYYILFNDTTEPTKALFLGKSIIGQTSGATGFVESFLYLEHPIGSASYYFFASIAKSKGSFLPGETVEVTTDNTITVTLSSDPTSFRKEAGYYKTEDGHLSSSKKLQDNYYYQDFSYELQSPVSSDRYIRLVRELIHPAGFEWFGKVKERSITQTPIGAMSTYGQKVITDFESLTIGGNTLEVNEKTILNISEDSILLDFITYLDVESGRETHYFLSRTLTIDSLQSPEIRIEDFDLYPNDEFPYYVSNNITQI